MIPTRLHAIADYLLPAGIAALSLSPRRGRATRRIMRIGPVWHYGYTLLTRYEGGFVPAIGMRAHLACDAAGALTFVGAAALLRDEPVRDRLLLAALGLGELAVIAFSDRHPPRRAVVDHTRIGHAHDRSEPAMDRDTNEPTSPRPDSTGPNSRPRDTTIAQTGEGIPDDSGRPVQVDEAEAQRIAEKLRNI